MENKNYDLPIFVAAILVGLTIGFFASALVHKNYRILEDHMQRAAALCHSIESLPKSINYDTVVCANRASFKLRN